MPTLDFPSKYKNELQGIIREYIPDAEVWAFGSRINQQSHESSDLDLAVRNIQASGSLEKFKSAITNSNIPILIDILNWENIPQSFKEEILKQHVVIYKPMQEPEK